MKSSRLTIFTTLFFLSTGCAVHQPYINPSELDVGTIKFQENPQLYAKSLRSEYYESLQDHSIWRTSVAYSSIGLLAFSAYKALTGSSNTSQMTALAIGAGSIYAIDGVLYKNASEAIYAKGIKSVNCVEKFYGYIPSSLNKTEILEAQTLLSEIKSLINTGNKSTGKQEILDTYESKVKDVTLKFFNANTLLKKKNHLYYNALSTVNEQVTAQLVLLQPDPSEVKATISNYDFKSAGINVSPEPLQLNPGAEAKQTAASLSALDKTEKTSAEKKAIEDEARENAVTINQKVQELRDKLFTIEMNMESFSIELPEDCEVETITAFAIGLPAPAGVKFDIIRTTSIESRISGTSGNLTAHLITRAASENPVVQVISKDGKFFLQISTSANTTQQSYSAVVRDEEKGKSIQFEFEVK